MIEPNTSWHCQRESAWQPPNFNYLTVNAATRPLEPMPVGQNAYNVRGLPPNKGVFEDEGWLVQRHSFLNTKASVPTTNPYANEHQFRLPRPSGHDWKETLHEASYSQEKKFLIFDRSGDETRMILSTLCSPICNQTPHKRPTLPSLSEDSGENRVLDEDSDYHEDTEEIDALLYSSDNDIDDEIYDNEDEDEISTGRCPSAMTSGFENLEEVDDFDEVSSYGPSSKRQKLHQDGSCGKLSSMETKTRKKPAEGFHDDESVIVKPSSLNGQQAIPSMSSKRSRMHKIHNTLRIVQKLIPGSKTEDPLVIIDEAISYLKSLKANSPDMDATEVSSSSTPFS